MPLHYDTLAIDPLFSTKLLESEVIPESEQDLIAKIEILYASLEKKTPLYYQGSALGSQLQAFSDSDDFIHFTKQLDLCFEQLCDFCNAQTITISTEQGPLLANILLQAFLDKLKTDFFSDRRALLYGPGKKYIETLSVFINEAHIDLTFRTSQIINLLSDEGLTQSCAEGCFTRLQYAADSLKNYENFELPSLYKNYLQLLVDEIIHRPMLIGGDETITQKVAKWMGYNSVAFEVHVRNFVIKKFKEKFQLRTLELVIDEYVNTIENFFIQNSQKTKLLDHEFKYLVKNFNQKATVTNFINYLGMAIHNAFSTQTDYMERIKFLEEKALPSFGQDTDFSLAEVLSEESGLLKNAHCLDITITERLLNKGWLVLDWTKRYRKDPFFKRRNSQWQNKKPPFPPLTDSYKIFYGNLALSWVKVDTQRQKIVTILQQSQGLKTIQSIYTDQTALLNSLIQTPDDLATFFNHLDPSKREPALGWIRTVPEFVNRVLSYYFYDPTTNDLLEPLLSFISQLNTQDLQKLFAKEFNLKNLLQSRIEKLSDQICYDCGDICTGLIKKICSLDIIDFTHFMFYTSRNSLKGSLPYLIEINFSGTHLDFSIFYENVYRCSFTYTELNNIIFYNNLFLAEFTFSQLKNTRFLQKVEQCNFNNAHLLNVGFSEIIRNDFSGVTLFEVEFRKKITLCNLNKAKIVRTLFLKQISHTNFQRAQIKRTIIRSRVLNSQFKFSSLDDVEFYDLIFNTSFAPAYLTQVKFYAEIIENKFNFATLDQVTFLKKINKSIFNNAHLIQVIFEKEISYSIFDYMTGSDVSFKENLFSVNFINLYLNQGQFNEKIVSCDFSYSNLYKVNFFAEIIDVKFNTANLNELSFNRKMQNCDFVGSRIYLSSFSKIELNDINFINTNLLQINFAGSYLTSNSFTKTNLIGTNFQDAILDQVTFNDANLESAVFKKTQFKIRVDFIASNLKNADFSDCDLSLVNFHDSNLQVLHLKDSIVTPRQLFDNFYSAGIRDFSEVSLNEDDINKSDFLLLYKEKSLEEAILSESIFKGLIKLGYRNFSKTDLSKLKLTEFIHLFHNIEYNFLDTILPEIFSPPVHTTLQDTPIGQRSLSLRECLPKEPRPKRDAKQCVINWSDIDPFNLNNENKRNFEEIIIDSKGFIETLFLMPDKKKQAKLIELIDTAALKGTAAPALIELRTVQKLKYHFYHVGMLFNALSQGLMYENIVMDFLHENYNDVAINVGLLAGSSLSEKFAQQLLRQSEKFGMSGKVIFSKFLKLSTPFLRRGLTTGYMIYDLVNQASALTRGNKDALINALGDSFFISVDVFEMGIEVLEYTGINLEIAEMITATDQTLGFFVLGNTQVYYAVREVAKIKALIPLTPWQTLIEGIEAFLHINPSENIQTLLELHQAYATYSINIKDFLEKNPTIKYYVLPTIDFTIKNIRNVCKLNAMHMMQCRTEIVKHLELIPTNVVFLEKELQPGMVFYPLNPLVNNFNSEEIFCNPYKVNIYNETLICNSALVIVNPWGNKNHNQTLFALNNGNDIAYGFKDSATTFIVNDGYKIYVGGNYTDRFIIKASNLKGLLDGSLGSDLLDLRLYSLKNKSLSIDLPNGILKQDDTKILSIPNFERILGRTEQKDSLFATYSTEFVDLQAGSEFDFDEITIDADIRNAHLEMIVRAHTIITNLATQGDFIYLVPGIEKTSDNLNITKHSSLFFSNYTSSANHTFLFDYDLFDLNSIQIKLKSKELFFNFLFTSNSSLSNYTLKLKQVPTQANYFFKDDTRLKIGEKANLYAFQTSTSSVHNLIEHYAPVARHLGITLFFHQPISNEVIVIGHNNPQVLNNDLSATKTHLVANGGGNSYVIIPDKLNTTLSVPDVILYQLTTDKTQHVLDLRLLNLEIENGILDNPCIKVIVKETEEDLRFALSSIRLARSAEYCLSELPIINIVLRDGKKWYSQLMILFNRVPLQLLEIKAEWKLHPQPLNFQIRHKNIILTKDDIEKDNQIFLHRPINQQQWLRNGSDLWLTTLFNSSSTVDDNYTILFKEFYQHAKMRTLQLIFSDSTLLLCDCANEITNAEDFQKKITALELSAWNDVSKHRSADTEIQDNTPAIQARLLNNRLSHAGFFTSNVPSSAASVHQGYLSSLKKSVQKTLSQLQTGGKHLLNACWDYAFHTHTEQGIAANQEIITTHFCTSSIDNTQIYSAQLSPLKNSERLGQQNKAFHAGAVVSYTNFNSGILQLMDLAVRKYHSQQAIPTQHAEKCTYKPKKSSSSTLFLQQRCDRAYERLQEAIAKYGPSNFKK